MYLGFDVKGAFKNDSMDLPERYQLKFLDVVSYEVYRFTLAEVPEWAALTVNQLNLPIGDLEFDVKQGEQRTSLKFISFNGVQVYKLQLLREKAAA